MEGSPESERPLKRVKYAQQDGDITPVNIAASDIRVPDGIPGSMVPDVSLFDNTWSVPAGLASPSQVLYSLSEDLNCGSWVPTFPGEETNLLSFTRRLLFASPFSSLLPHPPLPVDGVSPLILDFAVPVISLWRILRWVSSRGRATLGVEVRENMMHPPTPLLLLLPPRRTIRLTTHLHPSCSRLRSRPSSDSEESKLSIDPVMPW